MITIELLVIATAMIIFYSIVTICIGLAIMKKLLGRGWDP